MTEAAFQEARKVMAKANYLRGMITTAKGNVAKWTKIEAVHRSEFRHSQADGANKMLQKALKKLDEYKEKFAALSFPDKDLKTAIERCNQCGAKIEKDGHICEELSTG